METLRTQQRISYGDTEALALTHSISHTAKNCAASRQRISDLGIGATDAESRPSGTLGHPWWPAIDDRRFWHAGGAAGADHRQVGRI